MMKINNARKVVTWWNIYLLRNWCNNLRSISTVFLYLLKICHSLLQPSGHGQETVIWRWVNNYFTCKLLFNQKSPVTATEKQFADTKKKFTRLSLYAASWSSRCFRVYILLRFFSLSGKVNDFHQRHNLVSNFFMGI